MSEKSWLDKMFDSAEAVLTPVEKVLKNDDAIDADFVDVPASQKQEAAPQKQSADDHSERWEKNWEEPKWAVVTAENSSQVAAWHAFPEGSLKSKCNNTYESHRIQDRQVLEHGKTIAACTSCIIAVSK